MPTYTCPLCGAVPSIEQPLTERITSVKGRIGILGAHAGGEVRMAPARAGREIYACDGCGQRYVRADIDPGLILGHLSVDRRAVDLIRYYYPQGVTLTDLIRHHVTGSVRRRSGGGASLLPKGRARRRLYVCFNFKGIRTYGVFERRKKGGVYHYAMIDMGVPNI